MNEEETTLIWLIPSKLLIFLEDYEQKRVFVIEISQILSID